MTSSSPSGKGVEADNLTQASRSRSTNGEELTAASDRTGRFCLIGEGGAGHSASSGTTPNV
ncbi:hypothetical protein Cde04nite_30260 [Cellulomonas denverensis]|nr:hypothetical protein Cde04nite_30260 [Cellulomonas denverensis]